MYAMTALSNMTTVQATIDCLTTTAAGMSFLFGLLFSLAGLFGIFVLIADVWGLCQDIEIASDTCMALAPKAKSNGLNKTQVRVINALSQGAYELWKQEMRDWRPSKKYNFDQVVGLLAMGMTPNEIEDMLDEEERIFRFY